MPAMKGRKRALWICGALVLPMLAASCNRPQRCRPLANLDPSGESITFWYQHQGEREQILLSMIAEFNQTNEWGIEVQGTSLGSYANVFEQMVKSISTGQIPELVVAYANQAAVYAKMGGIVELTPYIECPQWGFSEQELEDFFPPVLKSDVLPESGKRYGFPTQRSMEVLYYNEDWLSDLGHSHPPRTWKEFEQMACEASDEDAGAHGYILSVDASTFADMLVNRGGTLLNADATGYAFGDHAGLQVLTFLHDLAQAGCLSLEREGYQDRAEFGAGRAVFNIGSTSHLPDYRKTVSEGADFSWSISTLPTDLDTPRVDIYGASLSVGRTTPEKQLASWLFIKWLAEPEQMAHWARSTNYFPVRRSVAEDLEDYFAENPQYAKAFGFLEYEPVIEPGVESYAPCRGPISEMLEAAALGGDPATLLRNAVDECNGFWRDLSS